VISLFILALQGLLVLAICASSFFYLWCAVATWRFFNTPRPNRSSLTELSPLAEPASLLIPVCGLEADARQNWLALCQQHPDHYQVLFGVMSPQDSAIPLLEEIVALFPERARLILCPQVRGVNYKVSNLMQLLEQAEHDLVVFADSDIQVGPDYLQRITAPLADPEMGLVTCAYVSRHPQTLGAALAAFGRCVDFIPSVLVARQLDRGLRFAMGATIATRQSVLAKLPEFATLVNRAGDDYHIGRMVSEAGYRVELSDYVVEIDITTETLQQVFRRELRWSRSIRCNRGGQYYGLATAYGTIYCLLLLPLSGFAPWAIAVTFVCCLLRGIQALIAIYCLDCFQLLAWSWALPLRDGFNFYLWVLGVTGNRIYWRGRWLEISAGGFIQERVEMS
jgi:ceramide glucosyltransferase